MLKDLEITDYAVDARTHVVEVAGQIDLYSAPELEEHTTRIIGGGAECVIVELSRVTFIDSTGLGVLVNAMKRMRAARAELLLVVTDYDIERLFKLTGLDNALHICRSLDEALAHLFR